MTSCRKIPRGREPEKPVQEGLLMRLIFMILMLDHDKFHFNYGRFGRVAIYHRTGKR
jgi:hypothetical protein